jgi:hypothetical protein
MKPDTGQAMKWTWLQEAQGSTVKMENSEDLNKKCWILRDKELYPNRGETDIKGPHVEGRTF